ncbi:hypothetical protein SAMN06272737_1622 [Blastococcus mobilis]|uniref:Uncharacterized protein n=1 Tax=Blastococcus mobilis TaxID=1938746 RepID=A0A239AXD3_9ACTN|nr:hypothetical protein SAMN06272737_1622 [Blastococcus mobilis]
MLASTVQFSTYDQTPATRPHPTQHPPQGAAGGMRCRPALQRSNRPPPADGARSLRTQQRAYDPAPTPTPLHTPHQGRAVLGAGGKPAAELVSVPPSSTTPETRSPPEMTGHRVLSAALDHHSTCGGQCSLERR